MKISFNQTGNNIAVGRLPEKSESLLCDILCNPKQTHKFPLSFGKFLNKRLFRTIECDLVKEYKVAEFPLKWLMQVNINYIVPY